MRIYYMTVGLAASVYAVCSVLFLHTPGYVSVPFAWTGGTLFASALTAIRNRS